MPFTQRHAPKANFQAKSSFAGKAERAKDTVHTQAMTQLTMSLLLAFTFSEAYCVQQEQRGGATVRCA
jgi:hypothetical protein